ncbi:MAG: hypothetical protein AMXMBFR7_33050 [Planctomycetota bacterium]
MLFRIYLGMSTEARPTQRVIDRYARRVNWLDGENTRLAAKADGETDSGWIEGYAAVFGNIDAQGEVFVKGCFARTIQLQVPAGKVKLMAHHYKYGGDVLDCIGTIVEAKEDDYGLWIRAKLASTQLAQDVRTLVLEGHAKTLSVGFYMLRWEPRDMGGKEILHHLECRLAETTVTVKPVNELAAITGAKSEAQANPQDTGAEKPGAKTAPPSSAPSVLPVLQAQLDTCQAQMDALAQDL